MKADIARVLGVHALPAVARVLTLGVLIVSAASLLGCGKPSKAHQQSAPEVTLSNPVKENVTTYLEYTGTTMAVESVEVRARVAGVLESMHFEPRAKVKAGDLLFEIDPRPYQAAVEQAKAALEAQKAELRIREIELEKYTHLESKEVVAELKLADTKAARDKAKAEVERARANLEAAELDFEYSRVRSPIGGRVSRNLVDVGNLVGATEKTLLASIVNDDNIYVYFNLSELDFLKLVRKGHEKVGDSARPEQNTPVYMRLADEKGYPRTGYLDYTDIRVDPSTGTIQVRAVFPNSDGILYPGMFARVRLPVETRESLMVPASAVLSDQGGKYVLLCDAKDVVKFQRVRTGRLVRGEMRVIEEGLTTKDRVIVNGLQRARPGSKVNPVSVRAWSATRTPGATGSRKN